MRISLPKFHCDIVLTKQDLTHLDDFLVKTKGSYTTCIIISDENIFSLYGKQIENILKLQGLTPHLIILPQGETTKNLDFVAKCWEKLNSYEADRKSLLIGLGGGVITDVAGFTASCYMRGIDLINIPTTLLAMVDASIGGKNGINFCQIKNLVGTLHHPKLVLIAPHYLADLPDREIRSGIAEIIKAGVIWDTELFEFLENFMGEILKKNPEKLKSIIAKACKVKSEIIRIDEKEHHLRSILNYGHTFAHALETATNYSLFTHGEAVSIGMSCVAQVAKKLGYVDDEFIIRQDKVCLSAGLPIHLPQSIAISEMIHLMRKDKKSFNGKINLIIPRKIGKVDMISDIDESIVSEALKFKKEN
jgi:3-dehydroquinate synthase